MTHLASMRRKLQSLLSMKCTGRCIIMSFFWQEHYHVILLAGASFLMLSLRNVQDTVQVPLQVLGKMTLSAIGILEIALKYWMANDCAIDPRHRCDPRWLPTLKRMILATIYQPSMLPKHLVQCTSPTGSSDMLSRPESTQSQCGVYAALASRQGIFHLRVSILTTTWSLMLLKSESSSAQHPVELLHL